MLRYWPSSTITLMSFKHYFREKSYLSSFIVLIRQFPLCSYECCHCFQLNFSFRIHNFLQGCQHQHIRVYRKADSWVAIHFIALVNIFLAEVTVIHHIHHQLPISIVRILRSAFFFVSFHLRFLL